MRPNYKYLVGCMALLACLGSSTQEAMIRKNMAERLPQIKQIDEVNKSAVDGIYELRVDRMHYRGLTKSATSAFTALALA